MAPVVTPERQAALSGPLRDLLTEGLVHRDQPMCGACLKAPIMPDDFLGAPIQRCPLEPFEDDGDFGGGIPLASFQS